MSEEEKKTIETIKSHYNDIIKEFGKKANGSASCYSNSDINVLLNLIERQKEEKDLLSKMNKKLIDESISKNKVKELKKEKIKILEREKENNNFIMEDTLISQISVLDELLESE